MICHLCGHDRESVNCQCWETVEEITISDEETRKILGILAYAEKVQLGATEH